MTDQFIQYRRKNKGIFIATKEKESTKVLASAMDYHALEEILKKKGLAKKSIAIQYLEPKRAICAYGISLSSFRKDRTDRTF